MIDRNSLVQGDCIEGFARLNDGSVDLVFADPPFNIGYKYDLYEDRKSADEYLAWTRKWTEAVKRVLKPTGTFWLAIGDDFAAELKTLVQRDLGFCCRSWVIWYYTFGVNCTKKFSRSHTHLFHFVKDPKKFTFNAPDIKVPSARQLVYADDRAKEGGRLPDDTWILRPHDVESGFSPDQDTWFFPRVCGTFKERAGFHGCQMPEQLLARIIRLSTNERAPHSEINELVVDPFAGSGSTLIVAKKLGRDYLGFELSSNYVRRVSQRLDATAVGDTLEGAENPLQSAPKTTNGRKLVPSTAPSTRVAPTITKPVSAKNAILEAYVVIRNDYPADRVVADPELNQLFVETCRRWGIPGEACDWNRTLLSLRKSGRLADLPKSKRTSFTPDERDSCEFACEIAIQRFHTRGISLDKVLCDPQLASEFDRDVRSIVGKELRSFLMRWVAIGIRKRAQKTRRIAARLGDLRFRLPNRQFMATALEAEMMPATSGLYWLEDAVEKRNLYVGETLNLQRRLIAQIFDSEFDFWGTARSRLAVRVREVNANELESHQSRWIGHWSPRGNYCKLAAL